MEWGIAPWVFDRAPSQYRVEMITWYDWRNARRRMMREQAELNEKFFKEGRK